MVLCVLLSLAMFCTFGEAPSNVGGGQPVNYCDQKESTYALTDGNRLAGEIFTAPCEENAFLRMVLDKEMFIHYVLVYGLRPNAQASLQLNYFRVLGHHGNVSFTCSEYPNHARNDPKGREGMRVNCMWPRNLYSELELVSRSNKGFNLAEIELYSFGQGHVWLSRGCFGRFRYRDSEDLTTWRRCQAFCFRGKYLYAGIKENKTCHCGDDYVKESELPWSSCDISCQESHYSCGGPGSYALYLVNVQLPKYAGCIFSRVSGSNYLKSSDMTVAKCLYHCEDSRLALLELGDTCSCSNDLDLVIPDDTKFCDRKCSGDPNSFCGGDNDHIAIYQTCFEKNPARSSCNSILNCFDRWNEYGSCEGGCLDGYTGEHCLEKPLIEDACLAFEPCHLRLNTYCSDVHQSYTCLCLSGFVKNNDGECTSPNPSKRYIWKWMKSYAALLYFLFFLIIPAFAICHFYMMQKKQSSMTLWVLGGAAASVQDDSSGSLQTGSLIAGKLRVSPSPKGTPTVGGSPARNVLTDGSINDSLPSSSKKKSPSTFENVFFYRRLWAKK